MKTFKTIILMFAVVAFVSCKSKNKTAKTTGEKIPGDNMQVDAANVRLQISFISIGAGIDNANKEKYDGWLVNQPKKVKYDEAHWGREGEVDYCFTLSELNKKEQEKFITDTKAMLSKSNLVRISENVPCDKKKK